MRFIDMTPAWDWNKNKYCYKCKETKSIYNFGKDKTRTDGLNHKCKNCCNKQSRQYNEENRIKISERKKLYRELNCGKIKQYSQKYRKVNKSKIKARKTQYEKTRKKNDLLYNFKHKVRQLIIQAFKRSKTSSFKKRTKSSELLGCTIDQLRDHLASKFQPGMTFENHGQWHIDHIIPLASAKTQEEVEKLCHYTNLQPLWAADNIKKGSRI